MNAKIMGTGYELPAFRADNDYLATLVDTSDEWIRERTGICARHLAKEETTTSMAAKAARKALRKAGVDASEVELVIVATITGDTDTPSTACKVQAQIGADHAVAFDMNAACSGFLYGLHVADAFFKSGIYKNALVIGAEASEEGGILSQSVGSNGEKWEVLSCPKGGYLQMNGQEVFKFAVRTVPLCVEDALEKAGMKADDVDLFLLHQANVRILQSVAKRLKQPEEKFPMNMNECGNTSAASLPILMAQLDEQGRFHRGNKVVLSGFGAGLTWGACVIEW